jgi:hypothetical protein
MFDVGQMNAQVLRYQRCRRVMGVDTNVPASHGRRQDKVVWKENAHIRDGSVQIFDGDNANASSVKIMVNYGVVHARMLL